MPGGVNLFIGGNSPGDVEHSGQAAFQQLGRDLQWYFDQVKEGLPSDMIEALQPTFDKSQEMCPVNTGELKASGYLELVNTDTSNPGVEMGYAKSGVPDYALNVHEIPAEHEAPTRDKFLQIPVEEDYFEIPGRLVAIIKARTGAS